MHRILRSLVFVCLLSGCASSALSPRLESGTVELPDFVAQDDPRPRLTLSEGATLQEYQSVALDRSPAVRTAFEEWRAAVEHAARVDALPNPQIRWGVFLQAVETRVGAQRHQLGIGQRLTRWGERAARRDIAVRQARAQWAGVEVAARQLSEEVARVHNEMWYHARSVESTREHLQLHQDIEEIVRAKYRVGTANHIDLLRIQLEVSRLDDQRARLEELGPALAADLNALLDRPVRSDVPWATDLDRRQVVDAESADLSALVMDHPRLLRADERALAAGRATDLARVQGRPSVSLGLLHTFVEARTDADVAGNGDDATLATVSVDLPLWRSKVGAGVREAASRHAASSSRRAEAARSLEAQLHRALYEYDDAQRRIALYEESLLPTADEALAASLAAFETGEVDILDFLDIERLRLELQLSSHRARTDRANALARIENLAPTLLRENIR